MEHFFISRRFVRIKALQNLYAYTIAEKVHRKEAIEQVKKDFRFDPFLCDPAQKKQLAEEQSIAVALFREVEAKTVPNQAFTYEANKKIEQSVGKHLCYYLEALRQEQNLLWNGLHDAKTSIYTDFLYTLLLLVEWYKLAKKEYTPSQPANHLLKNQLAHNALLEELYHNSNWMNAIYKNGVSWEKDPYQIENWYRQFIQPTAMPTTYRSGSNNSLRPLAYILQNIIFQEGPINDFLAMEDLYWDAHKQMVKKFLTRMLMMRSTKHFTAFAIFRHTLEPKWAIETAFYSRLLTMVIQNSCHYEAMIAAKTEKWDSERILLTDKLILKLALAELLDFNEIPFKVSINEYIEIAKWYGTAKSGCFINGVLEGILKGLDKK